MNTQSSNTLNAAAQVVSPVQAEQQIQAHQLQALLSQFSTSQPASSQIPETQSHCTPTQLGQGNVIPGTPSSVGSAAPMSTPSPQSSNSGIAALIGPDIAQALVQGLTGSLEQGGGKGGRRFPCRSCKAFGHSWPKCPSLNVVNVIISLITSKKEQYDRDNNVKRVSEALAKHGVDPTALGVNLERNQMPQQHTSHSTGATSQLESAIMTALTRSNPAHTPAFAMPSPTVPTPPPVAPQPTPMPTLPTNNNATHPLQSLFASMGIQSANSQTPDQATLIRQPAHVPAPVNPTEIRGMPTNTAPPSTPCQPMPSTTGSIQINPNDPNAADTLRALLASLESTNPAPVRQPQHYKVPVTKPPAVPPIHVSSPNRPELSDEIQKRIRDMRSPAAAVPTTEEIPITKVTDTPQAKRPNVTVHTPGTPHNLARGLDEELSDMLDDDATSLCDRRDELEKQLQAYKDMVEELLSEKAAYSSSSSASSKDAKPAASAPKRPARAAPKSKGHEIGALDLPARRALTKAARVLKENDDVYAISPAAPSPANATQAKYVYVKGTVDHVETPFVYVKVFPECIIEGADNPPDIRVFDRHWVFSNEAYAREAIVSLNDLLTEPMARATAKPAAGAPQ